MGNGNSGRPRIRRHLGEFLWLDVSNLASFRDGDWATLQWRSGATVGLYGTRSGVEIRFHRGDSEVRLSVIVRRLPRHFGGTRPLLRCPRCARRPD